MRKEKKLCDVIHRRGLPFFRNDPKTLPKQVVFSLPVKTSQKDLATAQREFSMAESCGMSLADILPHNFLKHSSLFW